MEELKERYKFELTQKSNANHSSKPTAHFELNVERSNIRAVFVGLQKGGLAHVRLLVSHLNRFQVQLGQWTVRVVFDGYPEATF